MKEKLPTIAFEGINRVGKGTQIEKLKCLITEVGLSSVEIRGDGTRDGLGLHDGDPFSFWWQQYSKQIRESGTTLDWNFAAYILAKDIKTWREEGRNFNKNIVLLDRSLISRATFIIDREKPAIKHLTVDNLYPYQPESRIELEDILPDIIFELIAPKEIVLSRIDNQDPKKSFRVKLIEEQYDTFYSAKSRLPEIVQEKIITLDSSLPIDKVFDNILENLNSKLENWNN